MIQFDLAKFTETMPPVKLRTQDRLDWMKLHSFVLQEDIDNYVLDINDKKFISLHNYQSMSFEHFLNNYLTPANNIYVTDGIWLPIYYEYLSSEKSINQSYLYLGNEAVPTANVVYEFLGSELETDQVDFQINVSSIDSGLEDKIKYWADFYKPGGKTYKITYY